MKKICILFLAMISLFVCSCEQNTDSITRQKELESISVEVIDPYFNQNSNFDYNKILLFGHYSDGTILAENPSLAVYEGFDSREQKSDLVVTVKYKGKTADFHIIIGQPRQEKIWIEQYPQKLIYPENADLSKELDLTGLKLFVRLDDGTEKELKKGEYTYTVNNLSESIFKGCNIINLITNEKTSCSFVVYKIGDGIVTGVDVGNIPPRKYNVGNIIDFSSITITVHIGENDVVTFSNGVWNIDKKIVKEQDIEKIVQVEHHWYSGLLKYFFHINIKTTLIYNYPINCVINSYSFQLDFPITYKELSKIKIEKTASFPELYAGNEIKFSDDSKIKFMRIYGETEDNKIEPDEYNELRYSVKSNKGYDKATEISEPFKFENFGIQTIYFYYKPGDSDKEFVNSYDFLVHDAKMEKIEVDWADGYTPPPLDYQYDWKDKIIDANKTNTSNKDKIIKVIGKYSNGNQFTILYPRWSVYESGKPDFDDNSTNTQNGDGTIKIEYIGDGGKKKYGELTVPYKKDPPPPQSSS